VNIFDVGKLILIVSTPTLLGAAIVYAPKCWRRLSDYWEARRPQTPQALGPPIEQLAADLRRLLQCGR